METFMNIRIENLLPTSKGSNLNLEVLDSKDTSKISGGITYTGILALYTAQPSSSSYSQFQEANQSIRAI
jgi:hypothetical protein